MVAFIKNFVIFLIKQKHQDKDIRLCHSDIFKGWYTYDVHFEGVGR